MHIKKNNDTLNFQNMRDFVYVKLRSKHRANQKISLDRCFATCMTINHLLNTNAIRFDYVSLCFVVGSFFFLHTVSSIRYCVRNTVVIYI